MTGRVTWRSIIPIVAVIALAIAITVAVTRGGSTDGAADSAPLDQGERISSSAERTGSDAAEAQGDPLTATVDDSEIVPPKKSTKKPGTTPPAPDATPPAPSPDEQAYLDETRKVVEANEGDLAVVAEMIAQALGSGDEEFFEQLVSDGEPEGPVLASQLANDYPPIDTYALGANVNVFSTGQTTLYFAYALVTWTDGGLTSEHTIPIVLRYIDGEWRLSTLGEANPDLVFVQSVDL